MAHTRPRAVPSSVLLRPTLAVTPGSAAETYAQPSVELGRLAKAGALLKLARGIFVAVPVDQRDRDWLPSLEAMATAVCIAVHGPGQGALCGLSAARVHGALPRAISTAEVVGPTQHRPIVLSARRARVDFAARDMGGIDVESFMTELGPGLVTTAAQTILDLSRREFDDGDSLRIEAVRQLMERVDSAEIESRAHRARGRRALARARALMTRAV